jgi:hypothetical protein
MRRAPAAAAGLTIALCALVAAVAAALVVRSVVGFTVAWFAWQSIPVLWPLLVGVLVAGLLLVVRPGAASRAGVVALVCAGQLMGGGVAASRDWFNVVGATNIPVHRLVVILPLTMVLVVAATVVCCVASAVLWRDTRAERARWWRPTAPAYAVVGVVLAVGLPLVVAALLDNWQLTFVGQTALIWSLPWGAGLAVAGWLDRGARRAALLTVGVSVVLTVGMFVALLSS